MPAGGWFGEGSLLKDEPRRYDAVALRATRVALMPRATFVRLLDPDARVNQALQTLEKEGLLRVEYGGVTILDLQKLRLR